MVKIVLNDALIERMKGAIESFDQSSLDSIPSDLKIILTRTDVLSEYPSNGFPERVSISGKEEDSVEGILWIDHSSLLRLSNILQAQFDRQRSNPMIHNGSDLPSIRPSLYQLLHPSELYFKPKPIRERSEKLKEILENIKLEQDQKLYDRMISIKPRTSAFQIHDDSSNDREDDRILSFGSNTQEDKEDWKQVKKSITLIFNILFSVLGTVISTYWLLHHSYQSTFSSSVLISFSSGLSIFLIELILYWNYF